MGGLPGCRRQWPRSGCGRAERGRGGNGPGTLACAEVGEALPDPDCRSDRWGQLLLHSCRGCPNYLSCKLPSPCAAGGKSSSYPPLSDRRCLHPAWGGAAFSQLPRRAHHGQGSRPYHTRWELPAFSVGESSLWVEHLFIFLYIFIIVYIFIGYFYQGFLDYVHLFCITWSLVCM